MSKVKVAVISSLFTLVLVSITFALFLDRDKRIIDNSGTSSGTQAGTANHQIVSLDKDTVKKANDELIDQRRTIITRTISRVSPAVVGINVKEIRQYRAPWSNDPFWRQFFGSGVYNQEIQSLGSGVIISNDGYVLTNDHVAGTADEIVVTLTDGRQFKAEKVGTDPTTDICLLKIVGDNFPYVKLGDSKDLLIGEWVIAIGNPFGLFSMTDHPSVTVGVISALGMNLNPLEGRYYMNMIQTDASINQGNSGGPLVNAIGEMIGMNTIIYTAQGSSGNVGVGFAIPVNKIKKILSVLKEKGTFDRNYWTGLRIQDIDQGIADYFDLSRARGVLVREVERNSPADEAGIKEYDIITHVNGFRADNAEVLQGLLKEYVAGEEVTFTILREGEKLYKNMKLEKR
ncbi:MAG: trypsin-like peptidase domain-containing protein [Melioribacteraceae bacterium]|nr:trypsin-like peptidase domain-containing protein [Melioribacteraceae bacterium]